MTSAVDLSKLVFLHAMSTVNIVFIVIVKK